MKSRYRILALILVLVLCFPAQGSTYKGQTVYFTVIGDTLQPLQEGTIPIYRGGQYYVPYGDFTALGVRCNYYPSTALLTLIYDNLLLQYDLNKGKAYDSYGNCIDQTCIQQNGTIFIPVSFPCTYFSFTYSIIARYNIFRLRISGTGVSDAVIGERYADTIADITEKLDAGVAIDALDTTAQLRLVFYGDGDLTLLPQLLRTLSQLSLTSMIYLPAGTSEENILRMSMASQPMGILLNSGNAVESASEIQSTIRRCTGQQIRMAISVKALGEEESAAVRSAGYLLPSRWLTPTSSSAYAIKSSTMRLVQRTEGVCNILLPITEAGIEAISLLKEDYPLLDAGWELYY